MHPPRRVQFQQIPGIDTREEHRSEIIIDIVGNGAVTFDRRISVVVVAVVVVAAAKHETPSFLLCRPPYAMNMHRPPCAARYITSNAAAFSALPTTARSPTPSLPTTSPPPSPPRRPAINHRASISKRDGGAVLSRSTTENAINH